MELSHVFDEIYFYKLKLNPESVTVYCMPVFV